MKAPSESPEVYAVPERPEWAAKLERHLAQAAQIAVEYGVTPDGFAAAAWQSYLKASPEFAAQLEQAQFMAGLEQLRNSGRLAKA
jgi:hypothetical protein